MTKRFWLGTGWKMNKTRAEARAYVEALRAAPDLADLPLQLFVLPPFTALAEVARDLADAPVLVGAQNCHWAASGAWTGEISAGQIAECGASLVELGHSERRAHFNETDIDINRKVKAVLAAGLRPLVCIGETAEERALDAAAVTVARQARMALSGIERRRSSMPSSWPTSPSGPSAKAAAPPRPTTPTPSTVRSRARSLDLFGRSVPVLYGGSVNPANAEALAAMPEIDGLFVGRAAWQPEGLLGLARQVQRVLAAPH